MHYEVRFHLLHGKNYKHWQIKTKIHNQTVHVRYLNPDHVQLILQNCTLISNNKIAQQVYKSKKRTVCGWIRCTNYIVQTPRHIDANYRLRYSPIHDPYWRNHENAIVDHESFEELITQQNKVYIKI